MIDEAEKLELLLAHGIPDIVAALSVWLGVSVWLFPGQRRWPCPLNLLGATGCVVLVATLLLESVIAGLAMLAVGLTGRTLVLRRRSTTDSPRG